MRVALAALTRTLDERKILHSLCCYYHPHHCASFHCPRHLQLTIKVVSLTEECEDCQSGSPSIGDVYSRDSRTSKKQRITVTELELTKLQVDHAQMFRNHTTLGQENTKLHQRIKKLLSHYAKLRTATVREDLLRDLQYNWSPYTSKNRSGKSSRRFFNVSGFTSCLLAPCFFMETPLSETCRTTICLGLSI